MLKRLCVLALIISCTDAPSDNPILLEHDSLLPVNMNPPRIIEADIFATPNRIAITDSKIVVLDPLAESPVHVFERETLAYLYSLGRRGRGPGEFSSAWSVDHPPNAKDEVWIYDLSLARLTHLRLTSQPDRFARDSSITLTAEAAMTGPVWIGDSLVISPGMFQSGRLARISFPSQMTTYVGALPQGDRDAPPDVWQHAYQATVAANRSRDLFVLASRHASRIEILDVNGAIKHRLPAPFYFEPTFEVKERGGRLEMASGPDLRFGYVDVVASPDLIYALFSGRTRASFPGRAHFGEYIHIFSWDGHLRRVLHLPVDAIGIAVDDKSELLLAAIHEPAPALAVFDLKEVTRAGSTKVEISIRDGM